MNVTEAVLTRRAVKWYDPEHRMPEETFQQLMNHAILAPTAFNIQNWRFVRVTDRAQRQAIRAAAWDQAQVTDASVLFIMCADLKAHEADPVKYWGHAPKEVQDILGPALRPFYEGKERLIRDEGIRSSALAGMTLMLAAKGMGYDSCPMIGFDIEKVAELINLPDDHVMGPMVAVGKGVKESWPKPGQLPLTELVVENGF